MSVRAWRPLPYAGISALLAAITWADYATGYELGFFVFYFAPVALAAWYGSRTAGVLFAVLAGGCWFLSDLLTQHPYSNALLIYWETFMRLVSFLTTRRALEDPERPAVEEVLDVISHDLRAPLGALVGQAQLMRSRSGGDAFASARIEAILRCAARMETMIEDLLDSTRRSSRQLELRLEQVEIGSYLAELIDRFGAVLEPGRVRLGTAGPGSLVSLADRGRLDRIVLNLLLNALKFSPPDSSVEVSAERAGAWIAVRVADRGPGIPADELPHLFERFYRGRSSRQGGLGLGLYSVRLLVEAHGGAVRAEPRPEGGTSFVVTLPAVGAAGETPARSGATA